MFVLPDGEDMGKGGSGGHASNQPPVAVEGPVIYKFSPMTKADKIRAMSDEELAEFLTAQQMRLLRKASELFDFPLLINDDQLSAMWLDWLREEATE